MITQRIWKAQASDSVQQHWIRVVVPIMLFTASFFMAMAWLGHLKFKQLPFWPALLLCWLTVLPEYFLNVTALRLGHKFYTGAQMAAFRLCSGVLCVTLVSRFFLEEPLSFRKIVGFGLMALAMVLVTRKKTTDCTLSEEVKVR